MKYMGSKRAMLQNGLGSLILEESRKADRVVDLFCGAGSVVRFAAEMTNMPVLAIDLQQYSIILANAILKKINSIDSSDLEKKWLQKVEDLRLKSKLWDKAQNLSAKLDVRAARSYVNRCRELCEQNSNIGPIWNAYGGYYFSPEQAITFDYMLNNLPNKQIDRIMCQASLIITAMRCVASPGHTAQPFQPTRTARKYLLDSWSRDPVEVCKTALKEVCSQ